MITARPKLSAPGKPNRGEIKNLVIEIGFYTFFLYVFILAADKYSNVWSYQKPSAIMFFFHWIFLYVHEGGHFLFTFFGRTLNILGGSFWQVMFPFLSFLIALRDSARIAPVPLFLTGFNLMAVSLYMRDAPSRRLSLLGGDKTRHDWWNLFREWDMLDSAVDVADVTYWIGILLSVGSVVVGIALALKSYYKPTIQASGQILTTLDQQVEKIKSPLLKRVPQPLAKPDAEKEFRSTGKADDPWGLPEQNQQR
ncbi:MAG: hypothetical protein HYY49_09980 [Ignavibacteriales bacterium]|nr:hypothetical protein [Ignavibacteriales bacterium]